MGYGLLLLFIVSLLYSYPFYRGKRYFPANLKLEGVWGATAFLLGMLAGAGGHPQRIEAPLSGQAILAIALVFGGWSLVAALKDYKDIRADRHSGVQTVYTLALRLGWRLKPVHLAVKCLVSLCLLLPGPLLFIGGRLPLLHSVAGLPWAMAVYWLASRGPSRSRFLWVLACLNGYFLYLTWALMG